MRNLQYRKYTIHFIMVCILITSPLWSGIAQSYHLDLYRMGKVYHQTMIVSQTSKGNTVTFLDENGEKSINKFDQRMRPLESFYVDTNNKQYMHIVFDYDHKKIATTGKVEETYKISKETYDANGSLFYVFSQIIPEPNQTKVFDLLQSKEGRKVAMYLKYVKTEKVTIGTKTLMAKKYETGLDNPLLRVFWPYKYYYWFHEKDNTFLKYSGPGQKKKTEIIETANKINK